MIILSDSVKQRFLAKIEKQPSGCWQWTASTAKGGYGQFNVGGKNWKAHRLSWILHGGADPEGLCVCHKCDNPRCVNPDHMFLGTHLDNVRDKISKGRCGHTGARGALNGAVKVRDVPVEQIKQLKAEGKTVREIGPMFGLSKSTISNIINGKHWSEYVLSDER